MELGDPEIPIFNQPHKNRTSFSRKCSNGCLGILNVFCVLLCITLCSLLVVYTQSALKDLEATTENLKKELSQLRHDRDSGTFPLQEDNSDDSESSNQTWETHRFRKRRNAKCPQSPKVPPFVHLVGRPGHMIQEKNTTYFPWNASLDDPGMHGFELIGDSARGFNKIRVKSQGVYLVYSQVAVHGRYHVNQPHECSHETVCHRLKSTGDKIVLLSSLATQYQLGAPYEGNTYNQWLRALDTKVHMGVFLLLRDDELSVQVPPHCGNTEYSLTDKQSYFGLAELSHKWAKKSPCPQPTKSPGSRPGRQNGNSKKG